MLDVQNLPEEFEKACMQDTEEVVEVMVVFSQNKTRKIRWGFVVFRLSSGDFTQKVFFFNKGDWPEVRVV